MAVPPEFISATDRDTANGWLEFADTNSFTKTVSCITNLNRAFIAVVAAGGGRTVSSITIGGQALSLIGYIAYPSNIFVCAYGRLNAPTGNQSLAVTLSGRTYGYVTILQFDNTTGWRAQISSNQGITQNPSISANNLIADDLVVSACNKFSDLAGLGSGQTSLHYSSRYANGCHKSRKILSANGSTTFSYTSTTSDKYAHVVFSLIPLPTPGGGSVIWWFRKWLEEKKKEILLQPFPVGI